MKVLHCPRCREQLKFTGKVGVELEGGSKLALDAYICPKCGKAEFFAQPEETVAKVKCSACGEEYDNDFPRCPKCGKSNEAMAK